MGGGKRGRDDGEATEQEWEMTRRAARETQRSRREATALELQAG
jgi:hypothetical protein